MSEKIRQTVDTCEEDRAFLLEFTVQLDMLCGMVVEAVVDHPTYLLSPNMRALMAEKARKVDAMFAAIRGRMAVDNPGEPLTERQR